MVYYFNLVGDGKPIARIIGGSFDNVVVWMSENKTEDSFSEITLKDAYFLPLANMTDGKVDRVFIAGTTGSGKSWFARMMIGELLECDKAGGEQRRLVIFAREYSDKNSGLEELNPIHYDWKNEALPTLDELEDCVVLFDDIDRIPSTIRDIDLAEGKKKKPLPIDVQLRKLCEDCMQNGRKKNIDTYFCGHSVNDGIKTKYIRQESNFMVVFPVSGMSDIEYMLEKKIGLNKDIMEKIFNSGSRWICIHKETPLYIITEHQIFIPKSKYQQ